SHLYRAFMSVEKLTLSGRQVNVLMMLLYGSNGTEGARHLGMSEKTFSTHKQNLIKRLRVHNEVELLYKGMLLVRKREVVKQDSLFPVMLNAASDSLI
ncbi:LuxR family transcriptional regulator, partial [Escherichia coli]|nr:LuxR family transcriptional regulator [Escherichia coli]